MKRELIPIGVCYETILFSESTTCHSEQSEESQRFFTELVLSEVEGFRMTLNLIIFNYKWYKYRDEFQSAYLQAKAMKTIYFKEF